MRVHLAGKGDPISTVALPLLVSAETPQSFLLEDGVPFEKADWVEIGYTDFEVWCIGAAGGKGGNDGGKEISWYYTGDANFHRQLLQYQPVYEVAPPDIWEQVLEMYDTNARNSGVTYYIYNNEQVTPRQLAELQNPSHLLQVTFYVDPFVTEVPRTGGAGGGGGLQYVSGLLDDLPDSVPVTVGKAGSDSPAGQLAVNADLDPVASYSVNFPPDWYHRYPSVYPLFPPPQPGQDGGFSSFGDICQASGGKGGQPHTIWEDGVKVVSAKGGDGGIGGQIEAGGGGSGGLGVDWDGTVGHNGISVPGSDGSWDGSIGQGGGGGGGGTFVPPNWPSFPDPTVIQAAPGGKGSFSFSDTTMYGPQQDRQPYKTGPGTTPVLILPGGGGGARIKGQGFGSKAPGYSADGIAYIRLSRIVD